MTGRQARRVRQDRLVHRATTARKGRPVPPEPMVRQARKVHRDRRVILVAHKVRPVLRETMACKAPPVPQVRMARKARPVK